MDTHMGHLRYRNRMEAERSWMKIDRRSFRQKGSRPWAGNADHRSAVTLVANRRRALENILEFGIEVPLGPIFRQRVILLCPTPLQHNARSDFHSSRAWRRDSIALIQKA